MESNETSKYMPGPWMVVESLSGVKCIVVQARKPFDRVADAEPRRDRREREDTARLIAAAPELAEALAELVWTVNEGHCPKRALKAAYAAQEKAGLI